MVATRFPVGPLMICVDRATVRGVLDAPDVTPVPGAPEWLLGVCGRSGRAIAVLDVALLGGRTRVAARPRQVIVVETTSGPVGLAAEGPAEERRGYAPSRTGDLLVQVEPDTWLVDLSRLPHLVDAAIQGGAPAL